jgi:hypothetical protein
MTTFKTDSLTPGKYRIVATLKQRSSGKIFIQSDVFRILKPARPRYLINKISFSSPFISTRRRLVFSS